MDYYCDICDKSTKFKSNSRYLEKLTRNEFDKGIRIKHTIENPDFIDTDEIIKE